MDDVIEDGHGGECCGITHVSNFDTYSEPTADELKAAAEEFQRDHGGASRDHMYEAVLTDNQLSWKDGFWRKQLKKAGFKKVTRFRNSNSGNYCNVFHKCNRASLVVPARAKPKKG